MSDFHDPMQKAVERTFRRRIERVRQHYFHRLRSWTVEYRGYDPGDYSRRQTRYDGTDEDSKPVWARILQRAWREGVDPCDLIDAAFSVATAQRQPWPNMVLSDKALAAARKLAGKKLETLRLRFSSSCSSIRSALALALGYHRDVDRTTLLEKVLLDSSHRCPLTSYLMAVRQGCPRAAEYFLPEALATYAEAPAAWDQIAGRLISDEFRNQSLLSFGKDR